MRARSFGVIVCLTLVSSGFAVRSGGPIGSIIEEPCPIGAFTARMGSQTPLVVRQLPAIDLTPLAESQAKCVEALRGFSAPPPGFEDLASFLEDTWPELLEDLKTYMEWEVLADHDVERLRELIERIDKALTAWLEALEQTKGDEAFPPDCANLLAMIPTVQVKSLISTDLFKDASLSRSRTVSRGGATLAFGLAHMEFDRLAGEPLPADERLESTVGVLTAGYGVLDRFDLYLAVPGVSHDVDSFAGGSRRGIGDVMLDGRFLMHGKGRRQAFALQLGVTAPTGDPERLTGSGEWSGRVGAIVDWVVGRADGGKPILTPYVSAGVTARERVLGYGLSGGVDVTWGRVVLLTALTGAVEPPRGKQSEYVDGLVGLRVRLTGDPARGLLNLDQPFRARARVDGSLIYTRYLTDNGAIPSDGYLSLAVRSSW